MKRVALTRVAVTRAGDQADELAVRLRAVGFVPIGVPVIAIVDPADGGQALRAAAGRLGAGGYDWLVITSVNGARRLLAVAPPPPWPVRVAAIGPASARCLDGAGQPVDVVPAKYVAESLLAEFAPGSGAVLLPRAAVARDVLPDGLRALGYGVDVVEAYRTVKPDLDTAARDRLASCEAITFTSPSTVHHFVELFGAEAMPGVVVSIGPVTSAACAERGISVDVEAAVHTMPGLVDALIRWQEAVG